MYVFIFKPPFKGTLLFHFLCVHVRSCTLCSYIYICVYFSPTTLAAHRAAHPPPQGVGRIGAECAGYACGRGAAWVSWDCGSPTTPAKKKAAHAPLDETSATALLEAEGSLAGLSKTDTKTLVKTRCLGLSGASKCSVLTSTDSVQVRKKRQGLGVPLWLRA